MERPSISFFLMDIVLLFVVIGFIFVVFDLRGLSFIFELGVLLSFMFFLTFAMFFVYHQRKGSWGIIGAVLVLLLFDVFIIFLLTRRMGISYVMTVIFAILGLVLVLYNVLISREDTKEGEVVSEKLTYYYPYITKEEPSNEITQETKQEIKEEVKQELKAEQKSVVSAFTPGKYIASRNASKFHIPRCVWANNINKENHVWFDSKADAESKGYSEHNCDIVGITTVKN